ncbi:MAG: YlmH/Sll1252 family protein [Lachnospiraceae bacterium]|nr:YlmH/Sll1252 family protein [Lachnospiraceae bacterium]
MKQNSDDFIRKHFSDLDGRAYSRDYPVFTDFLDLNEISILHRAQSSFKCHIATNGGYDGSERQMAVFLPSDAFSDIDFPIYVLKIEPINQKYAEQLTHRDYLGALMNLMIKRELMGDLIVKKNDNYCILFCVERIAGFIAENLVKVRHTEVSVKKVRFDDDRYAPDFREEDIIITSDRLDSFVAACAHSSRSAASALIDGEKIFLNGKTETSHKTQVKEGDILTIRGKGKLRVSAFNGKTQKDRLKVRIGWYD